MHVQIHAKRFGATEGERDKQFFNHAPAVIDLSLTDRVRIEIDDGVVRTWINDVPQMPVAIGKYLYTAYAICYGDKDDIEGLAKPDDPCPQLLSERELKDALAAGDIKAIKAHNAARKSQP